MNFCRTEDIFLKAGILFVIGFLSFASSANGQTAPAGEPNWQIVNDIFAAAVKQQSSSNTGVLPQSVFSVSAPPIPASIRPEAVAAAVKSLKPDPGAVQTAPAQSGKWGWLSEVRGGLLKHSAAISTSTPKERGVDGNIEVLFVSPDWLRLIWAPRPHLGASFNASSKDTDQIYAGLTWEWEPFQNVFIDASFGGSVHNGRLHINGADEDSGRRREFGCKTLFRESIEFGYRITAHHNVSLIWDHISHGGLCDDENEGMDNAGIRYGYRF